MSASIAPVQLLLAVVRRPLRFLALVTGFFGFVLYVWYTAVRAVPNVKRRKAAQRRARQQAASGSWEA